MSPAMGSGRSGSQGCSATASATVPGAALDHTERGVDDFVVLRPCCGSACDSTHATTSSPGSNCASSCTAAIRSSLCR